MQASQSYLGSSYIDVATCACLYNFIFQKKSECALQKIYMLVQIVEASGGPKVMCNI